MISQSCFEKLGLISQYSISVQEMIVRSDYMYWTSRAKKLDQDKEIDRLMSRYGVSREFIENIISTFAPIKPLDAPDGYFIWPIDELCLPSRIRNALVRANILTIQDIDPLIENPEIALVILPNFGTKSFFTLLRYYTQYQQKNYRATP